MQTENHLIVINIRRSRRPYIACYVAVRSRSPTAGGENRSKSAVVGINALSSLDLRMLTYATPGAARLYSAARFMLEEPVPPSHRHIDRWVIRREICVNGMIAIPLREYATVARLVPSVSSCRFLLRWPQCPLSIIRCRAPHQTDPPKTVSKTA